MTPIHTIDRYGNQIWTTDGEVHRDGGPAVVTQTGQKYWYQHGKLHRDGAPAVERVDGTGEYYHHGEWVGSKER